MNGQSGGEFYSCSIVPKSFVWCNLFVIGWVFFLQCCENVKIIVIFQLHKFYLLDVKANSFSGIQK